jgi:hypothetical protein
MGRKDRDTEFALEANKPKPGRVAIGSEAKSKRVRA